MTDPIYTAEQRRADQLAVHAALLPLMTATLAEVGLSVAQAMALMNAGLACPARQEGEARVIQQRFWARVEITPTCWLWRGGRNCYGYARLTLPDKTQIFAHRYAYESLVGPIPDGLELDHVKDRGCTNRHCVNPAHLEPVTHKENNRRSESPSAKNARATHCMHGHAFTPENTHITKTGGRSCRACNCARVMAGYSLDDRRARYAKDKERRSQAMALMEAGEPPPERPARDPPGSSGQTADRSHHRPQSLRQ